MHLIQTCSSKLNTILSKIHLNSEATFIMSYKPRQTTVFLVSANVDNKFSLRLATQQMLLSV